MDMQNIVSNISNELNNELIISDNEQLAMTIVPNGESHLELNLPTISDELTVMSAATQLVRTKTTTTTTTIFPNGESHELNFPNGDESHHHHEHNNFTNGDESHHHHEHNFPNGESHEHNFPPPPTILSDHDNSCYNDFDVGSLLAIVDHILTRSTHIIHTLVQGFQPSWERMEDSITPDFNFVSPLCTLRKISSKLSCKAPGTAEKTTLAILEKLTDYEWDAKAVITLAALAMEYGHFWVLADQNQNHPNHLLAKSVGVLKRVNGLTMYGFFEENSQAILELNTLINTVRQLIHLIVELWKHKDSYNTNDVNALIPAINEIPDGVKWCIITIAAIATQIDSLLITASHHTTTHHDLSLYFHKINVILASLRKHFKFIKQQIAEHNYIIEVRKRFQTTTTVLEVFKLLFFSSNAPQLLYEGVTKRPVNVEVLREKKVLLFISTLEVTHEEISVMLRLHEGLKTNNHHEQYRLVWIPMVEEWTMTLRKKMEILKAKMPWYVIQVQQFGFGGGIIAGHKFIKQEWQFKKTPMVVVMDHQGKVKHKNAFQFIKVWGIKAFPFDQDKEDEINMQVNWLRPIICDIYPTILPWIEAEEKYILFYGGTDQGWVQKFTNHARIIADDMILKTNNISMELFCVEREEYKSVVSNFWSRIQDHFMTIMNKKHELHTTMEITKEVTLEVRKMASFKGKSGWALLTKGSTVILSGYSDTVLTTVMEFNKWRETVITKGFEVSFKEHHTQIEIAYQHSCSMISIENVAGKLPHVIECPYCPRGMDMISVAYKCCHNIIN